MNKHLSGLACGLVCCILALSLDGFSAETLKPRWRGLVDRKGLPPAGWETTIDESVLDITWKEIENTKGNYVYSKIDTRLTNAAAKNGYICMRLFCGYQVPGWLKTECGSVDIVDNTDGHEENVVQWWKPQMSTAYRALQQKLAERYDGTDRPNNDRLRVITMSMCTSIYAEPFIKQLTSSATRTNLRAAGYTGDLDKAAEIDTVQIHADTWKRTYSSIALNPYQDLKATSWGTDVNYTLQFMDQAKAILGDRLLLQNNSISQDKLHDGQYLQIYNKMHDMYLAGSLIGFQTATMTKQKGQLKETIQAAINYGAFYVELPSGYDNATTANVTRAELDALDAQLEAQELPEPDTSYTRGSKWSATSNSSTENSGYNANNSGVTGSMWLYDNVTTGGALATGTPWYKEAGAALTWKSTNWGTAVYYPIINQTYLAAWSGPSAFDDAPRCSWVAPGAGTLTLAGNIRILFATEAAAKSVEWSIARKHGSSTTALASAEASVTAEQGGAGQVTRTINLSSYPALTNINVSAGDAIQWSLRFKATSGTQWARLLDDQMTLDFQAGAENAVRRFTRYK